MSADSASSVAGVIVVPTEAGRTAHDSQRALPAEVAERLYRRLHDELGSGPVLDVGAGSGIVSAALVAAGSDLLMVDVADWRDPVAADVPLVLGAGAALPMATGAFSGVHLARVLHHVPVWPPVLAEAARVLAPGGTLCLSLGDAPVDDALRELANRAVDLAEAAGLAELPIPAGPPINPANVDAELAGLGLPLVTTIEESTEVGVTPREAVYAAMLNPFRWVEGQDDQLLELADSVLAESALDPDAPLPRARTVRYRVYRRA